MGSGLSLLTDVNSRFLIPQLNSVALKKYARTYTRLLNQFIILVLLEFTDSKKNVSQCIHSFFLLVNG